MILNDNCWSIEKPLNQGVQKSLTTSIIALDALAHEAAAVNEIKRRTRFTVVIGNPPYSKVSGNMSEAAQQLVESYKYVDGMPLGERKHWLQDDYVKFTSICEKCIQQARAGVVGLITNHAYLDNPTFRGLRRSLMSTFSDVRVLDLHGNINKGEVAPDGSKDSNVFDIRQGVAISLASRQFESNSDVFYRELWGIRSEKYRWLDSHCLDDSNWERLHPEKPYYFFVPKDSEFNAEYARFPKISEIMPIHSTGILTARDRFVVDFVEAPLLDRIKIFLDMRLEDDEVRERLRLTENYAWRISDARRELASENKKVKTFVQALYYRPFDTRKIFYHPAVVWRTRKEVMK